MSEVSFSNKALLLLETLQERMESVEALEDLDMDLIDGVLTVEFEDGGQMIVNRQSSAEQIWLASPLGPAHFSFDADKNDWLDDKTSVSLKDTLEQAFASKLGQAVHLDKF
ncbi:MAG: iron donor protein CyaY [Gammaproteobacteria bacterium]